MNVNFISFFEWIRRQWIHNYMRTVKHAVELDSNSKHVVTCSFYAVRRNESILTSLTYNYYQLDEQAPNVWLRMANQWRCTDSFLFAHKCEKDVSIFSAREMNQTKPSQSTIQKISWSSAPKHPIVIIAHIGITYKNT